MVDDKNCKKCNNTLPISCFRVKRNTCKCCEKKYSKSYYHKNKDNLLKINKDYRNNNKEKEKTRYKNYDSKNRNKRRLAEKERYKNEESFRLRKNLRSRLYYHFSTHNITKCKTSCDYGINYNEIINYLGLKPSVDYTIDHIIPLSLFDFTNVIHIQAAFLPENHQWLLGSDNFSKSDNLLNNDLTNKTLKIVNDFILSKGGKEKIG